MKTPAQIEAWGIGKTFGTFKALDDISLRVRTGDFLSLLGPSGSGKTTFLTVLAGFYPPDAGSLMVEGREITRLPARERGFGMVFQGYALFPHLSVRDNIAFPLKVQKRSAAQVRARVDEMIGMVGLEGHGHKKPSQLSGGQQQRVALARALAYEPKVLLLDEPFSALDRNLRGQMQDELRRLHRELGTTFVFVTHDQEEALALSSQIAIFNHGKLQQVGAPDQIYDRPANRFVAEFIGEINILPIAGASVDGHPVTLPPGMPETCKAIALRPERMGLARPGQYANQMPLRVTDRVYLGSGTRLQLVTPGGTPVVLNVPTGTPRLDPGAEVLVGWKTEDSLPI